MNYFYAQLDANNICIGISQLSAVAPEYNYVTTRNYNPITKQWAETTDFVSRMIPIEALNDAYIGLHYIENGNWE